LKNYFLLFVCFLFLSAGNAQVKSPEEFLGYKIGTRYTPHYRIVDYFQYVSKQAPDMVHLEQYGETNEHRPLYLSFISLKENIANLENIRLNNLRLAHLAKDKMMPTEETPAIVWLSYNVHGNETSSAEAAMLTLYALVSPSETRTKEWLKNTVVVIDPCLNPDGRERYINWYNSMIGQQYNPLVMAREHREPWPGGRSNHYNFDLNRDWVWQTQVESRQRIAQYNRWLPQVHVDFHEQGVNSPYYFAPAAEPYHEVLTAWQREFQKTIGRNHAKYFDQNGWLYFTRERFDLFYPSYGDTYPVYNGSIGMTYEQGGISAGLGILTNEKDTLTLVDRALHHFTSSMSTIEISSMNATKLVKEFHSYFNDAISGKTGDYKTYVIKNNPADEERIMALKKLLDQNGINYGTGSGSGKGYNYLDKKESSFNVSNGDLLISSTQPRAAMVKVLFEPQSKLADSVTYDITAWSLPYAYGLEVYASRQNIAVSALPSNAEIANNVSDDAYGYVIRWQGVSSAKAVAAMLQKGIKMRFSEIPFEQNGQLFGRGSVIITKKGNASLGNNLWKTIAGICNANKVKITAVGSGMVEKGADFGSNQVHQMKAQKVVLLTGDGVRANAAGEIWSFFDNELDYRISLINANDFNRIDLSAVDVIIMPDGKYRFLDDKESSERFKTWVEKGGKVVALEGAVAQLSKQKWSNLQAKEKPGLDSVKKKDAYSALKIYGNRERDELSDNTPGAIYKVDVDNTHPLMFGYPNHYYTLKMDSVVYEFIKNDGWNVGVVKKENQVAGYVGYKLMPKIKDGLLFGVQDLGKGNVIYLADDIMFRNFWENGKLMLCNAVFMVGE
jgi:Zinc carboxypeptidase